MTVHFHEHEMTPNTAEQFHITYTVATTIVFFFFLASNFQMNLPLFKIFF